MNKKDVNIENATEYLGDVKNKANEDDILVPKCSVEDDAVISRTVSVVDEPFDFDGKSHDELQQIEKEVNVEGNVAIIGGPYSTMNDVIEAYLKVNGMLHCELADKLEVRQGWISEVKGTKQWKDGKPLRKVSEKFSIAPENIKDGVIYFNHSEFRGATYREMMEYNREKQYASNQDIVSPSEKECVNIIERLDRLEELYIHNNELVMDFIMGESEKLTEINIFNQKGIDDIRSQQIKGLENGKKISSDVSIFNDNLHRTYDKIESLCQKFKDAKFDDIATKLMYLGKTYLDENNTINRDTNSTNYDTNKESKKLDHIISQLKQLNDFNKRNTIEQEGTAENTSQQCEKTKSKYEHIVEQSAIILALALIFVLFEGQNQMAIIVIDAFLMVALFIERYFLKRRELAEDLEC